jgi:N-acetyl sugar amidotransferase
LTAKSDNYQICTRCVMDTSDPEIVFDSNGVCNLCSDFLLNRFDLSAPRDRSSELRGIFQQIKSKGRGHKYDCIVGVSGGVDSSAVLRLSVQEGLRVLAVHMDNGWNSPIAVQNISELVDALGVDYASYVLPWNEFREVQVAFLKASIPEVETPTDIAIARATHHFALAHKVPYILSGGNNASEGILPVAWHYNSRDTRYSHSILRSQGCPSRYFNHMRYGFLAEFYTKVIRGIKTIYPLNYVVYNKEVEREILERDYGWKYYGSKHGESRYTKFIQTYYLYVKHGIDYRRATASSEIFSNGLSRDAALSRLTLPPYSEDELREEISFISKKLLLTEEDLKYIISAPPKWYFDYPNNKSLLGFAYDAYRYLYKKKKTSNF